MAGRPSLVKEGKTAAGGCCRDGWILLALETAVLGFNPRPPPLGPSAQHPLLNEAGSLIFRSAAHAAVRHPKNENGTRQLRWRKYSPLTKGGGA